MSEDPSAARFPTTHWSRIAAAGGHATPDDREALAELCRAYRYPLYALIRRQGYEPADVQGLTQSYFGRLLERGVLAIADRSKGRFRAFLGTDCPSLLLDQIAATLDDPSLDAIADEMQDLFAALGC